MFTQIVVPLDGSTFAEAALPLAIAVSRETGAMLHLVSVVEPIPDFATEQWDSAVREWYEDYLEKVAGRVAEQSGGDVTTGVRSGLAVETLLTEAGGKHADLIVMATHGRGALARAWLGSVADGLVRHAEIPVILVRPTEGEAPVQPVHRLGTILVPLDGSPLSECALEQATELGELFGAAYHLTRVVPYPLNMTSPYMPLVEMYQTTIAEAKEAATKYLEAHAERMRGRGLRVTTSLVVGGQAGHGVLEEAKAVGCDLIAMATHGRSGVGRLMLGSDADKVLRGAHVPLLLYRPAPVPALIL